MLIMSSRQPEVNKNKILDWLIADGVPHTESDVSKLPTLLWSIQMEGIAIYCMSKLPDRVIIQADIVFLEEQQNLLNKQWESTKLTQLLLSMSSSLTNFNVRKQFLFNKDEGIRAIRVYLFLIDGLNKESIMNAIVRISEVLEVTLNQLSSVIGIELEQLKKQQEESSVNPLAT